MSFGKIEDLVGKRFLVQSSEYLVLEYRVIEVSNSKEFVKVELLTPYPDFSTISWGKVSNLNIVEILEDEKTGHEAIQKAFTIKERTK